jgi:hypothetical protein
MNHLKYVRMEDFVKSVIFLLTNDRYLRIKLDN